MRLWRKRLDQEDPATLDIGQLTVLHLSTVAKLALVNETLRERYQAVADILSTEREDADGSRKTVLDHAVQLHDFGRVLNLMLEKNHATVRTVLKATRKEIA